MAKKDKGKKEKPKEDEAKTAELRRQQQIAAKAELRKKMEEEAHISKLNSLKIVNQWRKIMRLAKAESLKKDIDILSQNHERDVDRKDAILQMLDRDLEEAEDQYQMSLRMHLVNMDALIKLHDSRLYELERSFQKELKTIQNDFTKEKEMLTIKFRQEKRDLQAIIDTIENEESERESEAKLSFEQQREESRNKNLEEINILRIYLDAQIEELEQQFETAHLNYLQQTSQRTHDFKELTQNDQKLSMDIDQKKKKIESLTTAITHWRAKIRQLQRETEERNRLLREEKHAIQKHYQQLKQRIHLYRGTQNQRLLHLSTSANECKQALRDKLDVARRVLHLGELSRKMETMLEQILPFGAIDQPQVGTEGSNQHNNESTTGGSSVASQSVSQAPSAPSGPHVSRKGARNAEETKPGIYVPPPHQSSVWNGDGGNAVPTSDRLANFYRKYNRVLLDNIAIEKERSRLATENAQLEDLLKQYVDGTRLTESTLMEDNPLFVVNGRANLNSALPVRKITTIQDASQIQAVVARQGR